MFLIPFQSQVSQKSKTKRIIIAIIRSVSVPNMLVSPHPHPHPRSRSRSRLQPSSRRSRQPLFSYSHILFSPCYDLVWALAHSLIIIWRKVTLLNRVNPSFRNADKGLSGVCSPLFVPRPTRRPIFSCLLNAGKDTRIFCTPMQTAAETVLFSGIYIFSPLRRTAGTEVRALSKLPK